MDPTTYTQVTQLLEDAAGESNPWKAQKSLQEIRQLFYRSGAPAVDPMDRDRPPAVGDYIQPLLAPSRYLVVPAVPVVPASGTSPGERLEFTSGGGILIGFRGTVVDFTVGVFAAGRLEQASIGVQMTVNGDVNLITNGVAEDFALFSDLFGDAVQWSPILRKMEVNDIINFLFRNNQPLVGGNPLQPSLTFAFWRLRQHDPG
jgi:hypothetical protein